MSLREQISSWEQAIRNGRGSEVAEDLLGLDSKKIPDSLLPSIANFARRVGEYQFGLKLLQKEFLQNRNLPTQHEALIAEYTALLTEIGATSIAERLLIQFKKPQYEMTPFYRALLWMKKWDYEKVPAEISLFKSVSSDPYRLRVADVNLLSAYIMLKKFNEAHSLLEDLKSDSPKAFPMLQGIISEQEGELLFFTGQQKEAKKFFQRALEKIGSSKNPSAYYAEKWIHIINLQSLPWNKVEAGWRNFLGRVQRKGYWEIIREMERYYAIRYERTDLLNKLYFGTPFATYRRHLCEEGKFTPDEEFLFPKSAKFIFDSSLMTLSRDAKKVAVPIMYRKLLSAFTRDLYKPAAVGSLFEALYPDQHFDPAFASSRVYRLIARLRDLSLKQKIGIQIEASDLGFRLKPGQDYSVRYTEANQGDISLSILSVIQKNFPNRAFTANELAEASGISKRTINRSLAIEIESGTIAKIGAGKSLKYNLTK